MMHAPCFTLLASDAAVFYLLASGEAAADPVISPGLALGQACRQLSVDCLHTAPGIKVTGKGFINSAPTIKGAHWYVSGPDGASGKAEGCNNSTVYFTLSAAIKFYHGELVTDTTHNENIQAYFDSDPSKVAVKEYLSTRAPGADLFLACKGVAAG